MAAPAKVRLFVALMPTDGVRQALVRYQAEWKWPPHAILTKPERLHLTLHFLGDTPTGSVHDLRYVLDRVFAQRFTLQFGAPDMWPHGTAVLRPRDAPTALRALHARIGLALAGIGIRQEDRPFRPHVTLARRAQAATVPSAQPQIEWESDGGFALVQSHLGSRGYEVLQEFGPGLRTGP